MSYQDLSEAVGVRKASIDYYFPTKEYLIATFLDQSSAYILGLVDQIIAEPEPTEMKLRRYCTLFEATLSNTNQGKACLGCMIGAELESLNHLLKQRVVAFYRANQERIATILKEGRNAGVFRFAGDVNVMAMLIYSLLEGGMLISRVSGDIAQYRAMIEQIIKQVKG